ncbi:hypothetical protein [Staphylococcus aureus]
MNRLGINQLLYYLTGNLHSMLDSHDIFCYCMFIQFLHGEEEMQRQYHHPLEEGFEERIHTPVGVRSLVEDSHLMKLLRELDKDGFNVDGPLAELVALVNYVTSSQMTMQDLQTHLDYCVEQLRRQTT